MEDWVQQPNERKYLMKNVSFWSPFVAVFCAGVSVGAILPRLLNVVFS